MSARTLVVIPTYNEVENILELVRAVLVTDPTLELLVVDDASPDGTGRLVDEACREEPRLHVLHRSRKLGLGTAYLTGFEYALREGFARIVTMDGDFSHHPRYLPALLEGMAGRDMMIGSRYVEGGGVWNWSWARRRLSAFANGYTRTLLRLPVRDCTSGYRCYSAAVLETVEPFAVRSSGYSFLEEILHRVHLAGFQIGEVPIVFEQRRAGASKISRSEIYRAAGSVLHAAIVPPRVRRRHRR